MNQFLILEDRINILSERCGIVIAKRNFPFRNLKVNLGFEHKLTGDYNDESFYSIPVLDFMKLGYENPEEVEKEILQHCTAHASARLQRGVVGPQRFLIRYAGKTKLILTEVSALKYEKQIKGRLSESENYWYADSKALSSKIPDFANQLARIEQEFQALISYREVM